MAKNKILITGGAGLIGSYLVKYLLDNKFKVTSIDIKKNILKNKNHFFFKENLKNFFTKNKQKYDVIIHTAAMSANSLSYTHPENVINNNIEDILVILKNIKSFPDTRLIFISSNQILHDFNNYGVLHPYALSKKTVEDILEYYSSRHKIQTCVVRLPDVYTSNKIKNKALLLNIIKKLKENKTIFIDNINHIFNFVNISDVCDLMHSIINKKKFNKHTIYFSLRYFNIFFCKSIKVFKRFKWACWYTVKLMIHLTKRFWCWCSAQKNNIWL